MNVRELFKANLENSEVNPGDSVRAGLMRKLAGREFIRFNPSRFNVFYLAGIVASVVIATLFITSNPETGRKPEIIPPTQQLIRTDTVIREPENIQQPEMQSVINKNVNTGNNSESSGKKVTSTDRASVMKPELKSGNLLSPGNPDSLQKKSMFKDNVPDKENAFVLQMKTEAVFEASSLSGCTPLKVKFLNRSISYDSCRWVFGDGGSSAERNPEWIFDVEGEYRVSLKVFSSTGSEAVASSVINVHPKPFARFEINPPNPIIPDDEIRFLNYSVGAVKYKWEFGDGIISDAVEPVHRYSKYQNYTVRLTIESEYGCSDSSVVINAFSGSGSYINFPNAFIPNPDGPSGGLYSTKIDEAAQVFHPVTSGVSDYQLRIFSRLGILIFESHDINIGWDGYLKGQLCEPGVYIWKVRGTYKNGEPFVKMGDITLLRR